MSFAATHSQSLGNIEALDSVQGIVCMNGERLKIGNPLSVRLVGVSSNEESQIGIGGLERNECIVRMIVIDVRNQDERK